MHFLLGTTIFIHQKEDICAEAPKLAFIIVYLSVLYLLYDTELVPAHWKHLPGFCKFIMDFLLTLLLLELVVVLIWGNIEIGSARLINTFFEKDSSKRIALRILLILLSIFVFVVVCMTTNRFNKIRKMYQEFPQDQISEVTGHGNSPQDVCENMREYMYI